MKKRKIIALILASTMLLSACSKNTKQKKEKTKKDKEKVEETEEEETKAPVETEALAETEAEPENNYLDEFLAFVDENNVYEAQKVWKDLEKDENLEEEEVQVIKNDIEGELIDRLDAILEGYNEGTVSDAEANTIIATISALNVLDNDLLDSYKDTLKDLTDSKSAYETALQYEKSEDYYNAYVYCMLVIPEDKNYSDASSLAIDLASKYEKAVLDDAEKLRDDKDYATAIQNLREALDNLGNNSSLQTELTLLEKEYLDYALDEASRVHKETEDYEKAIEVIWEAQKVIDDESLDEAIDYYKSFEPYHLFSDKSYSNEYWGMDLDKIDSSDMDMDGNYYDQGITCVGIGGGFADIYYKIDGKYGVLEGTIAVDDEFYKSVGDHVEKNYVVVTIYGDDKVLYTEKYFCNSKTKDIKLNIEGVEMVRFSMTSDAEAVPGTGNSVHRTVGVILGDFTVAKSIP